MTIDRRATVIAAINHEETPLCPYSFGWDRASDIPERLDANYGSNEWRQRYRNYIVRVGLLEDGRKTNEEGPALRRNHYGSLWRTDLRPVHLEEPALQKPSLRGYTFPEPEFLFPAEWDQDVHAALAENSDCFTVLYPGFGLFERVWTLRGFENALKLIEKIDDRSALPLHIGQQGGRGSHDKKQSQGQGEHTLLLEESFSLCP